MFSAEFGGSLQDSEFRIKCKRWSWWSLRLSLRNPYIVAVVWKTWYRVFGKYPTNWKVGFLSRSRVGLPYTRTEMTELTYAIRHASSYSTMISSTRSVPVLDTLQLITTQFSEMASSEMYSPSSNRKCIARRSLFVSSGQSSESFLEGFTRILYNFYQFVSHASRSSLKLTKCHACPASHRAGDEFANGSVKTWKNS